MNVAKARTVVQRVALALAVAAALSALAYWILRDDGYSQELSGFHLLTGVANEMIVARAPGVEVDSTGQPFIASLDDYLPYLRSRQTIGDDHPLDGILAKGTYTVLEGRADGPLAVLVIAKARRRPTGRVQLQLTAGGLLHYTASDAGFRLGPPKTE